MANQVLDKTTLLWGCYEMERFMAMRHFRLDYVLDSSEKVDTTFMRSFSRDRSHAQYG